MNLKQDYKYIFFYKNKYIAKIGRCYDNIKLNESS